MSTNTEAIAEIDGVLSLVRLMWLEAQKDKREDDVKHYHKKLNDLLDKRLELMAKRDAK